MTFSELTFSDLPLLKKYLPQFGNGDCDLSLVSLLSRGVNSHIRFFEYNHSFLVLERTLDESNNPVFFMPIGQQETPKELFELLQQKALSENFALKFFGRIDLIEQTLTQAYPGAQLIVENNPDRWDYIYACSDFVELPGSHFHSKRNFIKRFFKACPQARFDVYTPDKREACHTFLDNWYAEREMNDSLLQERAAIESVLSHWEELPVYGGILHENGRILGLTYGARSAPDILSVHIEKATREVPGAYPALSQAFAQSLPLCIEFLNREEDLGIPGLRKAKQDWHPVTQVKKAIGEIRLQ